MFQTTNQLKLQQIIWNWSLCSSRSKFAVANTWQSFWLFLKVFAHTLIAETTKQIIHRLSGNLVILRITQGICQDLWVYGKNLGQWGVDSRSSNFASWGKKHEKNSSSMAIHHNIPIMNCHYYPDLRPICQFHSLYGAWKNHTQPCHSTPAAAMERAFGTPERPRVSLLLLKQNLNMINKHNYTPSGHQICFAGKSTI